MSFGSNVGELVALDATFESRVASSAAEGNDCFLGDSGRIMLNRKGSDQIMYAKMNPADVRDDVNRFSIDFAHEQVLTGDRLEVNTVGGEDLKWIDHPDVD